MKCYCFIFSMLIVFAAAAQQSHIHIVTIPRNLQAPYKFNFTLNGMAYKLKAGHCIDLLTKTDSIHVIIKDNRWVKNKTIDVHTAAVENIYILIKLARNKEITKGDFYMAEIVCKECFEELKKKCTKEATDLME